MSTGRHTRSSATRLLLLLLRTATAVDGCDRPLKSGSNTLIQLKVLCPLSPTAADSVFTFQTPLTAAPRTTPYVAKVHTTDTTCTIIMLLPPLLLLLPTTLYNRDIATYNEAQTLEEAQEESGWKLVHGDVFRPPQFNPMLLAVLAGTGVQVFVMTLSTIGFAFMGFLSPANRGGMLTTASSTMAFRQPILSEHNDQQYVYAARHQWFYSTVSVNAVPNPARCTS
eukprot:14132-Heterococcus_DN1.PRE.8